MTDHQEFLAEQIFATLAHYTNQENKEQSFHFHGMISSNACYEHTYRPAIINYILCRETKTRALASIIPLGEEKQYAFCGHDHFRLYDGKDAPKIPAGYKIEPNTEVCDACNLPCQKKQGADLEMFWDCMNNHPEDSDSPTIEEYYKKQRKKHQTEEKAKYRGLENYLERRLQQRMKKPERISHGLKALLEKNTFEEFARKRQSTPIGFGYFMQDDSENVSKELTSEEALEIKLISAFIGYETYCLFRGSI